MMQVSRKVDYAMRSMAYLASQPRDRVILIDEICDQMSVPRAFLSKIMKQLVSASLVRSYMGPGGGYSLSREPEDITFRSIIEAVEGEPLRVMSCTSDDGVTPCALHDACTQVPVWEQIERRMLEVFDEFRLEQVKTRMTGETVTLVTNRAHRVAHPRDNAPTPRATT